MDAIKGNMLTEHHGYVHKNWFSRCNGPFNQFREQCDEVKIPAVTKCQDMVGHF